MNLNDKIEKYAADISCCRHNVIMRACLYHNGNVCSCRDFVNNQVNDNKEDSTDKLLIN